MDNMYSDDKIDPGLDLYYQGQEALKNGDLERAYRCLTDSAALVPHFKTYETLYNVLTQRGQEIEASQAIEIAHRLNPQNDKTAIIFAQDLFRIGDREKAKEVCENILKRNQSYGPAKRLLENIQKP